MSDNRLKIVNADTGDLVEILNTNSNSSNQSPVRSRQSQSRSRSRSRSRKDNYDHDKNRSRNRSRSNSSESDLDLNVLEEVPPHLFKMMRNVNSNLSFLAGRVKAIENSRSRSNSRSGSGPVRSGFSRSRSNSRSRLRSRSRSRSPIRRSRSRNSRSRSRSIVSRSSEEVFSSPNSVTSRVRRDSGLNIAIDSGTRGRRVTKQVPRGTRGDSNHSYSSRGMRDAEDNYSRGKRGSKNSPGTSHSRSRFSRSTMSKSPPRSRSRSKSYSPPQSIISLRAKSRDLDLDDGDNNRDVLDILNEELEVDEFGPPINSKLANTVNKKLNTKIDITSDGHKKKMADIRTPQNINCNKLNVPIINEELMGKHIGLDRFAKRNDNRLANIQLLATKTNILTIQSTNNLYSNLSNIESESAKTAVNEAIKLQTEAMGLLSQVKDEISKFRRGQLYSNLPKDIRGICFEKLDDDDEKLFGQNIKEKIKENKSNHYRMRSSPTFKKPHFLGRKTHQSYHHQQHPQQRFQVKTQQFYQKGKKAWNLSKRK